MPEGQISPKGLNAWLPTLESWLGDLNPRPLTSKHSIHTTWAIKLGILASCISLLHGTRIKWIFSFCCWSFGFSMVNIAQKGKTIWSITKFIHIFPNIPNVFVISPNVFSKLRPDAKTGTYYWSIIWRWKEDIDEPSFFLSRCIT
jgi:hypothetical protein